jgi:hypothetical protein
LPVIIALYALVRDREPEFAFLGALLGARETGDVERAVRRSREHAD